MTLSRVLAFTSILYFSAWHFSADASAEPAAKQDTEEQAVADLVSLLDDVTSVIDSVRDNQTAAAAVRRLNALKPRVRRLAVRLVALEIRWPQTTQLVSEQNVVSIISAKVDLNMALHEAVKNHGSLVAELFPPLQALLREADNLQILAEGNRLKSTRKVSPKQEQEVDGSFQQVRKTPLFALADQDGGADNQPPTLSNAVQSSNDPDHSTDTPRFQLARIGSGFGPKLENLNAAIKNTKTRFTQLESIRRQFWATAPGDAKREVLRKHYAEALLEKDIQLLYGGVTTGSTGFLTAIHRLALDGGVPEAARPAFDRWIEAIRDHMGIRDNQKYQQLENLKAFNLDRFSRAFEATRHFEEQYMLLRDWGEYHKAGREQEFYPTPEAYVIYLQRVDDEPLSQEQSVARYLKLAAMFGEEDLKKAANQQRAKPKTAEGFVQGSRMKLMYDLFERVSQGSDAGFIFNQFRLLARSKDRWAEAISDFQEMISLIDPKIVLASAAEARRIPKAQLGHFLHILQQQGDRECFLTVAARAKGMQWKAAGKQYQALCQIYGEKTILEIANRVRTAKVVTATDYGHEYIAVPPELANDDRLRELGSINREEAIVKLLQLETRQTELTGKLYENTSAKLSKENQFPAKLVPSAIYGGAVVANSGGIAIGVNGVRSPSLFGGLFGSSATTSRVLIFPQSSVDKPLVVNGNADGSFGLAMDLSNRYVVVGDRRAWLSNPKTGRGPRLNAGEAYVYDRETGKLVTNVRPPRDSLMRGLQFGAAVASYGDSVAIGATGKKGRFEDEGEVNVHNAKDGEHRFRITMRPEDYMHRGFGAAIKTDGKTLIISAPGVDKASLQQPGVFLHSAADGRFLSKLEPPEDPRGARGFGRSIAVSGRWAIVGFQYHNLGGAVLVYDVETGKLNTILKNTKTYEDVSGYGSGKLVSLIVRSDQSDFWLGKSVAIAGDIIVAASKRSLHVFDAKTSRHLHVIPIAEELNSDDIEIAEVSFDGTTIVATTRSNTGQNWTHHRIAMDQLAAR